MRLGHPVDRGFAALLPRVAALSVAAAWACVVACGRTTDGDAIRHYDGDAASAGDARRRAEPRTVGSDAQSTRDAAREAAPSPDAVAPDGAAPLDASTEVSAPLDARPPPDAARDTGPDVAPEADAAAPCDQALVLYAPWLAGPGDCGASACVAPPPGTDPDCRVAAGSGSFLYRTRECWQTWHPGNAYGYFVDFSREAVLSSCLPTLCGDRSAFGGASACGTELHVGHRYGFACANCDSDCAFTPVAVVVPASVTAADVVAAEAGPTTVLVDGSLTCRTGIRTCPAPVSLTAPDACYTACSSDADCVLVETSGCDCLSGGRRVAIHVDTVGSWPPPDSVICDGFDVCDDCASGYGGAKARCVDGACQAVCDPAPGCTGPDSGDVCGALLGAFQSVTANECGLGPNGPVYCNWRVSFDDRGQFDWFHSDVVESGTYACAGSAITAPGARPIVGSYDGRCDLLTWDGILYERAP